MDKCCTKSVVVFPSTYFYGHFLSIKLENVDGNGKIKKIKSPQIRSLEEVFAFFEKELMRKMGAGTSFAE